MLNIKRCYSITVSNEDWDVLSKTLQLYHKLIASGIYVKVIMGEEGITEVTFEYYIWNKRKIDMILMSLISIHNISMKVEME